jgi:hypothetical protein
MNPVLLLIFKKNNQDKFGLHIEDIKLSKRPTKSTGCSYKIRFQIYAAIKSAIQP